MKNFIFTLIFAFVFTFSFIFSATVFSAEEREEVIHQKEKQFSEAELAQMLAPIALYPDSLLTHILIASTYPIEIVEAYRWLKKNKTLNAEQVSELIKELDWDASVKALVPFERILNRLGKDLTWTQQLGDAFLQNEEKLLESIQALRKQAELAGNLKKMDNMTVSYEADDIIIAPVEKDIVYVPYYDTRMVYGAWYWAAYPPVYWTPHRSIYVSHSNPFYWHSGIRISFNYFFSAFHWHNRYVLVVKPHNSHYRYYHQRPRRSVSSGGYATRWIHKPAHRKGVAYRSKYTRQKYRSNRTSVNKTNKPLRSVQQSNTQRRFKQTLAVKNHSSNKRQNNRVTSENKVVTRVKPKSKPYIASVKYKTPQNKKVSTRSSVPTRKKPSNANRKPYHQQKSMKGHYSNNVKLK